MLPTMIFIFQKLLSKKCKYAMNLGVVEIRGALLLFFIGKKYPLISLPVLPSISKAAPL